MSVLGGMEAMVEARLQVEHSVARLTQALCEEKRRLNQLVPVARLPVELLMKMFMYYAGDHLRILPEHGADNPSFVLTHVCHHWREVALAAPELWSTLQASGPLAWLNTFLARSGTHPLDIQVAIPEETVRRARCEPEELRTIALALSCHFDRISRLRLVSCTQTLIEMLMPNRAPRLKSVILTGSTLLQAPITQLEHCDVPSLEVLEVSYHPISWASPLLRPTLTHLCLTGPSRAPGQESRQAGSFSQVLNALESMPLLQYLALGSFLPEDPQPPPHAPRTPPLRSVHLPELLKIDVHDVPPSCVRLLEHLVFPASTALHITVELPTHAGWQDVLSAVVKQLAGRGTLESPPAAPFLSAELQADAQGHLISFRCYRTHYPAKTHDIDCCLFDAPLDTYSRADLCLQYKGIGSGTTGDVARVTASTLRALEAPLSTVRSLALRADMPKCSIDQVREQDILAWPVHVWLEQFRAMVNVRELVLECWGEEAFPDALTALEGATASHSPSKSDDQGMGIQDEDDARARRPALFPELELLVLVRNAIDNPALLLGYCDAFAERRTCGHPLQELIIHEYEGMSEMWNNAFTGCVESVQWFKGQSRRAPQEVRYEAQASVHIIPLRMVRVG